MKNCIAICIIAFLVMNGLAEEFRIFTASDGRVIEARIVEYNPGRKKLRIEISSGKKVWVEPRIFGESDREYIRDWILASEFLSKTKLRMTIEKHKKSQGKNGDRVHYSITLQNRTTSDLTNLIFEYRFYVEGKAYQGRNDKDRCLRGSVQLDSLAAGEKKTLETPPELMVETYQTYTESSTDYYGYTTTSTYERKVWDDDARGIWFRIKGPELEGAPLVREEWYPKELNNRVAWIDTPQKKSTVVASSGGTGGSNIIKEAEKYLKGDGVEKDPQKAAEILTASFEASPDGAVAAKLGGIHLHNQTLKNFAVAEEWMIKAAELGNSFGPNGISMFYSSNKKEAVRNGEKAVKFGLLAVEVAGEASWVMDTLACAYARNNQFDLAVQTQEKAYELAKKSGTSGKSLRGYKDRLELFNQGQAWDGTMNN